MSLMKGRLYFCISVLLYLNVSIVSSYAQSLTSPFIIKRYTSFDGLPHNYILNLSQDNHGYLWVGTAYGLCKFDGVNFSAVNIKNGNKNIIATAGHEMPDGKIWIWTKTGSEYLFDGKRLLPVPDSLHHLSGARGFDGTVYWDWGQGEKYLGKLQTAKGWYYNYRNEIIFVDNNGDTLKIDQAIVPSIFMRIIGFADHRLYFYTDRGIYAYVNKEVKPLYQKQINGKLIYSCYRDSRKRFWIGTRKDGVYISKPGEEATLDYHIELANNLISGFYEDREGNMWIAAAEGLIKVQDILYEKFPKEEYPFLQDVNLVSRSENEEVLFFSERNGLIKRTKNKFIYTADNPFKGQLIDAICYDKAGRAWCVSRQSRLLMYDGTNFFDLSQKMKKNSRDLSIDITYDEYRKKIWITSDSLSAGDEQDFSIFKSTDNRIVKKPTRITALSGGKLIVATAANELFLIDSSDNITSLKTSNFFSPENILNFYTDSAGDLFLSSVEAGLIQCRLIKNDSLAVINRFNTASGLNNNFILSVAFDKQNRLWISTMAGIAVIDYKNNNSTGTQLVYQFGLKDGLPEFGIGYDRLACDANGDMWYTTLYSVSKFDVKKIRISDIPPPVTIENVSLNMKETDWNRYTDSQTTFRLPVNPVMKYYENTITISFKAATMTSAENIQYSYLLSGINNYWSNSSKSNTITFAKLKAGTYTFFVRARRNSMNWSTPALFSFTILKPYWQQWWFTALIILAAFGIIYWIYRIRISQLNKEKKIRDQIASDLHDDLGSTLNSVKVYANVAVIEKDNRQYLEKINENTQEAISSLRDIIWILDEKKDSVEHLFTRISQFALPLCNANHIQFVLQVDTAIYNNLLEREEKRNLFMIIKEVINNSIKYADCKTISLSASRKKNKMEIQITDDGKGYNNDKINEGHGIKNIYRRSSEIHYRVKIDSANGKGTSVILEKI